MMHVAAVIFRIILLDMNALVNISLKNQRRQVTSQTLYKKEYRD